jgi:hypothetical protein
MEANAELDSTSGTTEAFELNANDRCDVCSAQAYIRVELAAGDLMFCAHHGNERRAELEPIAVSWHDETAKLLVR